MQTHTNETEGLQQCAQCGDNYDPLNVTALAYELSTCGEQRCLRAAIEERDRHAKIQAGGLTARVLYLEDELRKIQHLKPEESIEDLANRYANAYGRAIGMAQGALIGGLALPSNTINASDVQKIRRMLGCLPGQEVATLQALLKDAGMEGCEACGRATWPGEEETLCRTCAVRRGRRAA